VKPYESPPELAAHEGPVLNRTPDLAALKGLSLPETRELADELRRYLIALTSLTGGHLGVNLGAVELNLATYRVFDSPKDVIIWAGHETYCQKLFTMRRSQIATLRQPGGLSGFSEPRESDHDWTCNTHVSIGLSYGAGVALARDCLGADYHVVACCGDGALTGGMALEALVNIGYRGTRVVILLNDNGRSYAPTTSRLSLRIDELAGDPTYMAATGGNIAARQAAASGSRVPAARVLGDKREVDVAAFFEALGIRYLGVVDGHDIAAIESSLREATSVEGPVLIHALTEKGRGYPPARADDEKRLHDVTPSRQSVAAIPNVPANSVASDGQGVSVRRAEMTFTDVFGSELKAMARDDPSVYAIVAAMPGSTGLLPFAREFPNRFVDAGIAEQHAVGLAAGIALRGLRPFVAIFSTFLMRAFDQINLDVGLLELPVVFCVDRAGITGSDGPSHNGVLDVSLVTKVPGITVFTPSSARELRAMMRTAITLSGPSVIRFPKAVAPHGSDTDLGSGLEARQVYAAGNDVAVIATGRLVEPALQAGRNLANEGIGVTVWDARVVAPLDAEMIQAAASASVVVTVEEGMVPGGLESEVAHALRAYWHHGRSDVVGLGTPRAWIPQGKPATILAELGLDAVGISSSIKSALLASTV
jgi:1-deoxy-D-xylulose-5-phosphate synthase